MPSARPTPPALLPLGSSYYLEHFEEMIRFVEEKYAHTFDRERQRFLEDFRSLDRDARCLYVRMANRKGTVFRISTLDFAEIESHLKAVELLRATRFARAAEDADLEELLRVHSRHELAQWIQACAEIPNITGISTAKKAADPAPSAARHTGKARNADRV